MGHGARDDMLDAAQELLALDRCFGAKLHHEGEPGGERWAGAVWLVHVCVLHGRWSLGVDAWTIARRMARNPQTEHRFFTDLAHSIHRRCRRCLCRQTASAASSPI